MRKAHFVENKRPYMAEARAIVLQLKQQGWTRRKIAQELNVHYITVKLWEKASICPSPPNFDGLRALMRR